MATKKTSGRSHGFRHKSRNVMTKKSPRGVSFLLREYKEGDQALIIIDPRQHKGLPHRRYHGKVGIVRIAGRRADHHRALPTEFRVRASDDRVGLRSAHGENGSLPLLRSRRWGASVDRTE